MTQLATNAMIIIGSCAFVIGIIISVIYVKTRWGMRSDDIDPYNGDGF